MFKFVHLVHYNSTKDQQSGFELHCTHKIFDEQLIQYLYTQIQGEHPIIVLNAKAELPPYYQIRLLQPMVDNEEVNWVNALTTIQHELSPLINSFSGTKTQLDQAVYLLQEPKYFMTSASNYNCFACRSIKHLNSSTQQFAVNNLLVETAASHPEPTPDTGDQRPLPAHPLSELQLNLTTFNPTQLPGGYPCLDNKPLALHIVMDWGGGVHQWTNDFIATHEEMNHLVLMSQGEFYRQQQGERFRLLWQGTEGVELAQYHLTAAIKATTRHHKQYQQLLANVVKQWQVQLMVVSSLIGHAMDCLNTGLPTLRILHDYFPHWPSLNAELD
ncbi:MAG: hypothetical protein ACSHWU_13665, partial [Marinicella sp.]